VGGIVAAAGCDRMAILLVGIALGALSRHPSNLRIALPVTVTATVTAAAAPPIAVGSPLTESAIETDFGDGLYQVGVDIAAGNYRTGGGRGCYWERLNNLSGGFTGIISNGEPTKPATVRVLASDKAFAVHGGCAWRRVG
jgi:hypothetical protein